jgi:SAM-dependent methyltransferase
MTQLTVDSLQIVSEIMQRRGARCTPAEFHSAVNVTFHNFESQAYDQEHADMWGSLPQQFALLVDDCFQRCPDLPETLRVLDIGAGTGLASQCLLSTRIGPRVKTIDLLDTSPEMLKRALERSAQWKIPVRSHLGLLDELPPESTYDFIVTCSVLHHVPDLQTFCAGVRHHQAPGGIFLHLQDPNSDFIENTEFAQYSAKPSKWQIPDALARFTPQRILGRIFRELTGKQNDDCVSKTNRSLLDAGFITSPLKVAELYAITDIHVHDGHGISVEQMRQWLPDYQRLSHRSYGFFGKLWSALPPELQSREEQLSQSNSLNGGYVAAAWRLRV